MGHFILVFSGSGRRIGRIIASFENGICGTEKSTKVRCWSSSTPRGKRQRDVCPAKTWCAKIHRWPCCQRKTPRSACYRPLKLHQGCHPQSVQALDCQRGGSQ